MEHLGETDGKPDNVVIKTESASAAVVDYQNACRLCLCIIESKSDATEIISVFSIFEDFLQYCHLAMTLANIKVVSLRMFTGLRGMNSNLTFAFRLRSMTVYRKGCATNADQIWLASIISNGNANIPIER